VAEKKRHPKLDPAQRIRVLDEIFDEIDEAFDRGDFVSVDTKLNQVSVADEPTEVLLAYLTLAKRHSTSLKNYGSFRLQAFTEISDRYPDHDYCRRMLIGL